MCSTSGAGGSGDRGRGYLPKSATQNLKNTPWGLYPDDFFYSMYRQYWEARKIVDIPPQDMTREGWSWDGVDVDPDDIEKIEQEESRLRLVPAIFKALRYERMVGAGAVLIGTRELDTKPEDPINISQISEGDLTFFRALPRRLLTPADIDNNPLSPKYLTPETYMIQGVEVHRSRLLIFDAGGEDDVGIRSRSLNGARFDGFGNSVLEPLYDDIVRSVGSRQGAFQLLNVASVMLLKKEGGKGLDITRTGKQKLDSLGDLMDQLSIYRGGILNKGEDLATWTASFGSVPQLMEQFLQTLSAASDIPATRFLGQAPGGLNATGDSDLINYYNSIASQQILRLKPELDKLSPLLERSATGSAVPGLSVVFNALFQLTEKDLAEARAKDANNIFMALDRSVMDDTTAWKEFEERDIFLNSPEADDLDVIPPGKAKEIISGDTN